MARDIEIDCIDAVTMASKRKKMNVEEKGKEEIKESVDRLGL